MTHLAEGTLRALLDGELPAERRALLLAHVAACPQCRDHLTALEREREWLATALPPVADAVAVDSGAAWRRLAGAWLPVRRRPWSGRGLPWAAAVLGALALGTLGFTPVRSDLLLLLRPQRVQVVQVSPSDLNALEQALVRQTPAVDVRGVASITARGGVMRQVSVTRAAAALPFSLRLPAPAPGTLSSVTVRSAGSTTFSRLDVPAVNGLLAALGDPEVLPASLANASVTLQEPAAIEVTYRLASGGTVRLLEAGVPALAVSPATADLGAVRSAILDLPLLPASLREQLAAIPQWQSTLPLPAVRGVSTPETVNGAQGVFLQGSGENALVWLSGGVVYAVRGPLDALAARALAASLR